MEIPSGVTSLSAPVGVWHPRECVLPGKDAHSLHPWRSQVLEGQTLDGPLDTPQIGPEVGGQE